MAQARRERETPRPKPTTPRRAAPTAPQKRRVGGGDITHNFGAEYPQTRAGPGNTSHRRDAQGRAKNGKAARIAAGKDKAAEKETLAASPPATARKDARRAGKPTARRAAIFRKFYTPRTPSLRFNTYYTRESNRGVWVSFLGAPKKTGDRRAGD